jgi:hypothetical protein
MACHDDVHIHEDVDTKVTALQTVTRHAPLCGAFFDAAIAAL